MLARSCLVSVNPLTRLRRRRLCAARAAHLDDRREHRGHKLFLPTRDREDIARTDGHAAARPHNSSSGDHPLAPSGREKVYLVLDGQDRGAGWHQSHGRVAASYVDNRRDNGSGEEAVMLDRKSVV